MPARPRNQSPDGARSLDPSTAAELLKKQAKRGKELLSSRPVPDTEFNAWHRTTSDYMVQAFGRESNLYAAFCGAGLSVEVVEDAFGDEDVPEPDQGQDLASCLQVVVRAIQRIEDDISARGVESPLPHTESVDLQIVERVIEICRTFHANVKQLRIRHDGRPTLEVSDEYDVQDLLHAVLHCVARDVRPEEWTPSYAGKASRMDFFLPEGRLVVEAKKTRQGLADREVADELIIDTARYTKQPGCSRLVCLVYDPEERIRNAAALQTDLSGMKDGIRVDAIVSPLR